MYTAPFSSPWVAFDGHTLVATGAADGVIVSLKQLLTDRPEANPVVLDAISSERIELDWRAPLQTLRAQMPAPAAADTEAQPADEAPRGPGRPKLGVTAREVTLLPRHWDWLSHQPGGASVALRKLVQIAMREGNAADARRRTTDAAYRFMSIVGGDLPHQEAMSRALFAGDLPQVKALAEGWPADVAAHLRSLLVHIDGAVPGN